MNQEKIRALLSAILPSVQPVPKAALEITGRCTCRCFHCYASILSNLPEMSKHDALSTLDTLSEVGFRQVYIVGGEPMLHPDIEEICAHSKSLGLKTILVTNGYLLDRKDVAEALAKSLTHAEISVRSDRPEVHNRIITGKPMFDSSYIPAPDLEGGFDNAINALKTLDSLRRQKKIPLHIAVNHDLYKDRDRPKSKGVVYRLAEKIHSEGIKLDGLYLQIMTISGRAKSNPELIRDFIIDKPTLILALEDLRKAAKDFGISTIRLADDPVKLGIISSINELSPDLKALLVPENIPAICSAGVKPNVVEDPIKNTD